MGEIAARTVLDRIEARMKYVPEIAIEPELVVRRSSARSRADAALKIGATGLFAPGGMKTIESLWLSRAVFLPTQEADLRRVMVKASQAKQLPRRRLIVCWVVPTIRINR